ncbi:hypothetical protein Tco_0795385 [Tanacetum coccineum]
MRVYVQKMTSATQEEPSEIDTFYRLHTVNGVFQDPEALRMYDRMRELEATGEHTTAEINAMVRGGKLRGHIPGVGPVMPGYVRSRLSYTAPVDRSRDVDFMMSLMRSDNRFADAFARYDSGGASGSGGSRARDSEGEEDGDDTGGEDGGDDTSRFFPEKSRNAAVQAVYKKNCRLFPSDMSLGKILPPWHQFLDQKIRGAHFSLVIVAGERFAIELTPSTFPSDISLGICFPSDMSLAKRLECRWGKHRIEDECFLNSYPFVYSCFSRLPRGGIEGEQYHQLGLQKDKLPTRLNLSRLGIDIHSIMYPICEEKVESLAHLLFSCSLAPEVLSKVKQWWGVSFPDFQSYEGWLNGLR